MFPGSKLLILTRRVVADTYPYVNVEAFNLVARMTVKPDDTRKALIDTLYGSIKLGAISGTAILNLMDQFYVPAAHDEQAGKLNWKADANNLIPAGASLPTFVTDRGYLGNGTSGHVLWGTAAVNTGGAFQQNSGNLFTWETLDVDAASSLSIGTTGTTSSFFITGRNGANASGRINNTTSLSGAVGTSLGLTAVNRTTNTAAQLYRNGVSIGTSATAANGTGLAEAVCFLRNNATYSTRRIGAGGKGNTLSANAHLDLYNALNAYMTAIGAA